MYSLYEKTTKSIENPYGIKKVEDNNPFLEGPCLLCLAAVNMDKSVFGVTKEGMKMARMRVRDEKNAGFILEDFPVKFLSMKKENSLDVERLEEEEALEKFVEKYMLPLVSNDGERIEVNLASKRMRNVNIISYCDGTIKVQKIEEILIEKMEQIGYTKEEIERIQSQMCMFPVATNRITGKQKSTCVSFHDINDTEVNDNITDKEKESVMSLPIGEEVITYSQNEKAYLYNGSGEHTLKKYQKDGKAMPVCLSSVISKALENSIENSKSDSEFKPINIEILTSDIPKIQKQAEKGETIEELREKLDEGLNYGSARRITEYEAKLMDQLDKACDNLRNTGKDLENKKNELLREKEKNSKLMEGVEKNCTELTKRKILMETGYQFGSQDEQEIVEGKSDKQIIEEIKKEKDSSTITSKDIAKASKERRVGKTEERGIWDKIVNKFKDIFNEKEN